MQNDSSIGQQDYLLGRQVSIVEVLDRALNKGAVIIGKITISVAGIPLLYVGLNLLITSIEAAERPRVKTLSTGEKIYGG